MRPLLATASPLASKSECERFCLYIKTSSSFVRSKAVKREENHMFHFPPFLNTVVFLPNALQIGF
jgi:hypothetical protein